MKTNKQYLESLQQMDKKIFLAGEPVTSVPDHPLTRPAANAVAKTYELARQPQTRDLFTTASHLTGDRINRFSHICRSSQDLVDKIKMLRVMGQHTACCFQRCAGLDALNTLSAITFEMDQELGTSYNQRFTDFLKYVQNEDLSCAAVMTDPKGDRGLRPSKQADPDQYLRMVEDRKEGIVVRGAKLHITGSLNSHELIVLPTRAHTAEDRDYAIAFAIPSDSKGITYICGRQPSDSRRTENGNIDVGNAEFGGQEAMILFDDVFVPNDRIFTRGEHQFCGRMVEIFGNYHRSSYSGCKSGMGDVLIGATALAAEYQGTSAASHIRDKLVEMTHLNETLYSTGIACAAEGHPLPSGNYMVDSLLANVCKLWVGQFPFQVSRLAQDVAGGILVTMPSEKDLDLPEYGDSVRKYLQGVSDVPPEFRIRILRLIENLTLGSGAASYLTESLHGAGSPQAQRIMIQRQGGFDEKKEFARRLAGIPA